MTEQEQIALTKYDLYYESRMTKMETIATQLSEDVREIKKDFRWLLGIIIGGNASLFVLMAHGFKWF